MVSLQIVTEPRSVTCQLSELKYSSHLRERWHGFPEAVNVLTTTLQDMHSTGHCTNPGTGETVLWDIFQVISPSGSANSCNRSECLENDRKKPQYISTKCIWQKNNWTISTILLITWIFHVLLSPSIFWIFSLPQMLILGSSCTL